MATAPFPAQKPSDQHVVVLRDPRAIKALAHPARLAVIDEFFAGRKLTATECADIAGLSASAMSYHLRALEKWGIIRRSAATGDGRERPWEAAGELLTVDSAEPRASAAGEAVLVANLLDRQREEALRCIGSQNEMSAAWYEALTVRSSAFWLNQAEAKQLAAEMSELLLDFQRRQHEHAPAGARRVRVSYTVVPLAGSAGAGSAGAGTVEAGRA